MNTIIVTCCQIKAFNLLLSEDFSIGNEQMADVKQSDMQSVAYLTEQETVPPYQRNYSRHAHVRVMAVFEEAS